jgi:hypothetical protein
MNRDSDRGRSFSRAARADRTILLNAVVGTDLLVAVGVVIGAKTNGRREKRLQIAERQSSYRWRGFLALDLASMDIGMTGTTG